MPHAPLIDFAAFYRATINPLRNYLCQMVGSAADAQDLAHDAYLRLLPAVAAQRLTEPNAFLYKTARNLAFNRLRRRRFDSTAGENIDELPSAELPAERLLIARQEWEQVERVLDRLPPGCRTVLILRKVDELSHAEIAQRLGRSPSTVEKQLARAIRLLRKELGKTA